MRQSFFCDRLQMLCAHAPMRAEGTTARRGTLNINGLRPRPPPGKTSLAYYMKVAHYGVASAVGLKFALQSIDCRFFGIVWWCRKTLALLCRRKLSSDCLLPALLIYRMRVHSKPVSRCLATRPHAACCVKLRPAATITRQFLTLLEGRPLDQLPLRRYFLLQHHT